MYETGGKDFWLLACWVERVSSDVTPRVTRAGTASGCTTHAQNKHTLTFGASLVIGQESGVNLPSAKKFLNAAMILWDEDDIGT